MPRIKGKRKQPCFKTEAEAIKEVARLSKAAERHGTMAAGLTGLEMAEIITARQQLKECGATITEATQFYLQHATRLKEPLVLGELVKRFRDDRWNREEANEEGEMGRYVKQLKVSLGGLARRFPTVKAHELTKDQIEIWLQAGRWKGKTKNNYLGDVSAMFTWAMRQGYARTNPTTDIERVRLKREEIGVLKLAECQLLLVEAAQQRLWRALSYVVLGMLAGLRPAEIQRLDWSEIDLAHGTVIVRGTKAKTGARRVVDLTKEAVAWLRLIPAELRHEGRVIVRKGWSDEWVVFRRSLGWDVGHSAKHLPKCGVTPVLGRWLHDALRHTYASMHYAHHQNEALLQVQMGHRSARMLHAHYRALKTRAEAEQFWLVSPMQKG